MAQAIEGNLHIPISTAPAVEVKGKRRPRDVFPRRAALEQAKINHVWILMDRNHNEYAVPPDSTYAVTLLREAHCVFCHSS